MKQVNGHQRSPVFYVNSFLKRFPLLCKLCRNYGGNQKYTNLQKHANKLPDYSATQAHISTVHILLWLCTRSFLAVRCSEKKTETIMPTDYKQKKISINPIYIPPTIEP